MDFVRFAKRCYIITSSLFVILGAVFLFWPQVSLSVLVRIVGVALIFSGVSKLIGYFSNDPYRIAFQFDFAMGVLTCAFGFVLLLFPDGVAKYLTVMIGIFVIIESLFTIQNAIEARRFGLGKWYLLLICGIASLALGICALIKPLSATLFVTRIGGAALLFDGIQNIIVAILTVKKER
ncbi:MAG: DUF308 domain-containing protein [Clostridia bacterium]|nr:DUF308 domain-containing protein [Clostridia bacterium]